jgi:hypothetical protein
MRSSALPLLFALLAVATLSLRASAQEEDAPRPKMSLQVIPKFGGFFMGGDFGSAGEVSAPTLVDAGGGLGYGLAVELALPREPFNARLSGDYVSGAEMRRDRIATGGSVDILSVTVDGVMRSFTRSRKNFQSYILAGVGIKHYSFTEGSITEPEITGNMMDWTGHLGFGLDFIAGPASIVLEANDYVSWFDSKDKAISPAGKMQNDLFLQVGVRITVF